MIDEVFAWRLLTVDDMSEVRDLVARVFNEFVAPEYSSEGVQEFLGYIEPAAFRERYEHDPFGLVALAQGKIVGVIEVRGCRHISLLFVAPECQHRGIARDLLSQALLICRAGAPGVSEVSVNSSSFAVPVYKKLGFRRAGERQVRNGIGFVPMALILSDQRSG